MRHLQLFEAFLLSRRGLKIYHGTRSEEDAQAILKSGWDENQRKGASAEGAGMGAFLDPNKVIYGEWIVEFEIPLQELREHIVFDTDPDRMWHKGSLTSFPSEEVIALCQEVLGRVESVEEQVLRINGDLELPPDVGGWYNKDIQRIKGWITQRRFERDMTVIHLRDTSIARPLRYFRNTYFTE